MTKVYRAWVNQPSTSQPYHHLNGTLVLAHYDTPLCDRVYFLSGPIESQQVLRLALSKGWPKYFQDTHSPCHRGVRVMASLLGALVDILSAFHR